MTSLGYLYDSDYESVEGDTQEEVPYIDPICFPEEEEKLSLVKRVSSLSLFGASVIIRVIFDMEENSACTPHKSDFVDKKMKINPDNIKVISK